MGYGVFRFIAEFSPEPDDFLEVFALGMSMGLCLSVPMIFGGGRDCGGGSGKSRHVVPEQANGIVGSLCGQCIFGFWCQIPRRGWYELQCVDLR